MSSYIGPKPSDQVVGSAGFSNISVGANVVLSTTGLTVGALGTVFVGNSTVNAVANSTALYVNGNAVTPFQGMRNKLINGAFDIWQRATTYSLTTSVAYGSADRWAFNQGTSANGVANQVASGFNGFQYALKIGRTAGATTTGSIEAVQVLESVNSIPLQGQQVTISFWAKAGLNMTSSSAIYIVVQSGTGTDQAATIAAGSWTSYNPFINQTQVLTTNWVRYSFTGTVPTNATQLGVRFGYYSPSGTAGADDNFYITGVQLEQGSVATPFERRQYGTELALCQRYYYSLVRGTDYYASATTNSYDSYQRAWPCSGNHFPVSMRATPTVTLYSAQTGTINKVSGYSSGTEYAVTSVAGTDSKKLSTYIQLGATTNSFETQLFTYTASAEL